MKLTTGYVKTFVNSSIFLRSKKLPYLLFNFYLVIVRVMGINVKSESCQEK